MSEEMGRCPICGGQKEPGVTTFTVDWHEGVTIVRGVPALVCQQCGETWIEDTVAESLEAIVSEARRRQTVIEVTQWQQVA